MSEVQLPNTWIKAKLGDVTEIVGGGTPDRNNPAYFQGDIPWATPTDITRLNSLWIDKTSEMITPMGLQRSSANLLPVGTVLMTSRASIGDTAINITPMATNQGFASFICNKEIILNEYLARWLPFVKERLIQLAGGTTFKEISKSTLSRVEIPLPPLPEQRRIAAILREADEIRKLRQEVDEKTPKIVEALFYDMFGDPEKNPKKWKSITLNDITWAIQDGPHVSPAYSNEGIPFLSTRNIRPGQIIWDDLKFISIEEAQKHWKKCKPEKGDVLYTKGGTTGLAKAIDFDQEVAIWVHIALLKIKKDLVDPLWLESMLNSEYCYIQSQSFTHGATNRDLGLTRMAKIKMFLPPLNIQRQYEFEVSKIQEVVSQQRTAHERLNTLCQSFFSQAFTGELTASWREQHAPELVQAASERDTLLQRRTITPLEIESPALPALPEEETEREDLLIQLSPFQHALYNIFVENRDRYFTANQIYESYGEELDASLDQIRRELRTLAALGLMREVSLRVTEQPEQVDYLTVYRYPQPEDDTRIEDLELLGSRSV